MCAQLAQKPFCLMVTTVPCANSLVYLNNPLPRHIFMAFACMCSRALARGRERRRARRGDRPSSTPKHRTPPKVKNRPIIPIVIIVFQHLVFAGWNHSYFPAAFVRNIFPQRPSEHVLVTGVTPSGPLCCCCLARRPGLRRLASSVLNAQLASSLFRTLDVPRGL